MDKEARKKRLQRFLDSGLFQDLFSDKGQTHTRRINPKLGILGFFGFLGFTGFIPIALNLTTTFPAPSFFFFFFFAFFAFFGFYYEGKMSDTLMDERFLANQNRAAAIANKTALQLIILISILSMSMLRLNTYHMLNLLIATIGLAFGLSGFLQPYLLYRFEHEE